MPLDPVKGKEGLSQMRVLDGVKLISVDVDQADDPRCYGQRQYTVSESSRLLLRYEDLKSVLSKVRLDEPNQVEIQVSAQNEKEATTAQHHLKLCPLTLNWMMLATWRAAAPFGSYRWSVPGGDYDLEGCILAQTVSKLQLRFNVTPWFIQYPKGRNINYGLILLADQEVTIIGEQSGADAPQILWKE